MPMSLLGRSVRPTCGNEDFSNKLDKTSEFICYHLILFSWQEAVVLSKVSLHCVTVNAFSSSSFLFFSISSIIS